MKQIESFKEFINNMKANPYKYIIDQNLEEKDVDKNEDDREKEKGESLIQYLLYASSATN